VAGAPTVWGTLWTVNDLSTALLMKEAYQNLKAGMNKPEALRAAQISVRDMAAREIYRTEEEAQTNSGLSRSAQSFLEEAKRDYGDAMESGLDEKSLSHPY
jgi:CHAT domain-containing protein